MKNVLLIINPKAGKMKAKTSLFDIIGILSDGGMRVTVEITKYGGHATELAASAADSFDAVICAGGDGTLNEAIAGILKSDKKIPLGYIPSGSTNDFASTLDLSKEPKKAAEDIVYGVIKDIDIGMFGSRHFSYVASFGAFTKASYSTPQDIKNALGHLAYVLEGIKDLPSIRAEHAIIKSEDGTVFEGDYIFGAIANSTSVGGIISLNDKIVALNDGKFEVLLVKKPNNLIELNSCINALMSQNYNCDAIDFGTLSSAEITTENPITWSLDGEEAKTDGKVFVRNMKKAISIILPRAANDSAILEERK